MFIVYIIKSTLNPNKHYAGFTKNLEKRLAAHNAGKSLFSQKYAPWSLECFITFQNEHKAKDFERYLKRGSGYAFFKKHLV